MNTALLEFPIFNQMTKVVVNYRLGYLSLPDPMIFIHGIRSAKTGVDLSEFKAIIDIAKLECEKLEGIESE